MGIYDVLYIALDLIATGYQRETILTRLKNEQDSGTPESEIPALLRKWRDEAIADAEAAK